MATLTAALDSDNVLSVTGLKRTIADTFENGATVQVTLTDSDNTEVAGETWPLAMAYVAASDGVYRATLSDTLTLTDNTDYTATITANAGAGLFRTFKATLLYAYD